MCRLICAFVVCIWHKTRFYMTWSNFLFLYVDLVLYTYQRDQSGEDGLCRPELGPARPRTKVSLYCTQIYTAVLQIQASLFHNFMKSQKPKWTRDNGRPWSSRLGTVAQSEVCPLGMQAAPSSIPTSSTFFHGYLVMKKFLRPFSLFRWFKKSSYQLLTKECALSTGILPRRLDQEQCG